MPEGIIRLDEGWKLDAGHRLDQPPNVPVVPVLPALINQPKKGKPTMDYIPNRRNDRKAWWQNFEDEIDEEGPKLPITPAEISADKAVATNVLSFMAATEAAQSALDAARAAERTAEASALAYIRNAVRGYKTRPNYATSGVEGKLRLKGSESGFDPATFKPKLDPSVIGTQVKVKFTKGECDSVEIYGRLRGQTGWTRLGLDSASPYFDTRPLANPPVPETREYMGIGVIDDIQVGVPSDIVSVAFTGTPDES